MTGLYVPPTEESDHKKQNMSLQLIGSATSTNSTNIASNTSSIVTNTSDIATINALRTSSTVFGLSKVDNTTITASSGVISTGRAAKSDQVTATSTTLAVTPSVQQNHPSAIKAWFTFSSTQTSSPCTLADSYNVSSVTRTSSGDYTVNFTTAFANANYGMSGVGQSSGAANGQATVNFAASTATGAPTLKSTTQCRILTANGSSGGVLDYGTLSVMFFGTQ